MDYLMNGTWQFTIWFEQNNPTTQYIQNKFQMYKDSSINEWIFKLE